MEVDEDDDEVVEELDVLLSKSLAENLYLLQYPITHSKRSYSAEQRLVARVKPQHKKLELEVLLDVSSPNYDQSKGEQIALNVDGGGSGEGMTYENSVMDTQVLSSRLVPQISRRFVSAVMRDGQVHLTPVTQIMQLQPSFKYMDRAEMRAIQAAKMKSQAESGNSSQDEVEDAKTVTVRFKGAETEAARAARERSYAAYEKRLYQEKWISAVVHHKEDSYADRERNRLFCNQACTSSIDSTSNFTEMSLSSSDYLKTLIPQYTVSDVDSDISPDNVLSLAKLKLLPLAEQLKLLMKNAKIIHYSHLLTLLPSTPDTNSVVRTLQSYAVLVQGCWIVKSEVLYPSNTISPVAGTPADLMCKVRDFILCLYTKYEYVVRRDVAKKVNVSGEEVKVIFEQIAKMKVGSGWHLKLPPDTRFSAQFPEVFERQSMVWAARYKQLAKQLHIDLDDADLQQAKALPVHSTTKHKSGVKHHHAKTVKKAANSKPQSHAPSLVTQKVKSTNNIPKSLPVNGVVTQNNTTESISVSPKITAQQVELEQEKKPNDFVPMQITEPMDFQFTDNAKSFTQLLNEADTGNDGLSILSNPIPFVIPEAVGIATSFKDGPEDALQGTNSIKLLSESNATGSINMDSINSTVALVTDQVRQCSNIAMQEDLLNVALPENNGVLQENAANQTGASH